MTAAAGEGIGPYRVVRRLGGGAMGVVYEADDPVLQRRVALKVISPHLAEDPAFRARFTREAQAQASLDSPHVVAVYSHGEADGRLYLASQLVPDGDLGARLAADGPPSTRAAVDLVAQVAAGLADAHAAGLVHRDIKPANVLLRRRDDGFQAYLADFGIARWVDGDDPRTVHSVGTPSYMAPELHTGSPAGPASDLYSLGCLLWATLTGRPPYAGATDYQLVKAHLEQPVPQLADTSPLGAGVNEVLRRSMAKDPAGRYPSAAAMQAALRRLGTAPPAPPVPTPAVSPVRRSRRLAGVVGALVVLVAVALGAAYVVTRDDPAPDRARSAVDPTPTPTRSPGPTPVPTLTSAGPTTPTVAAGDEQRAVASMGAALADQLGLTPEQGTCLAQATVDQIGLARLLEIGFFTPDLAFANLDLAPYPEVKTVLSTASLTCLTG